MVKIDLVTEDNLRSAVLIHAAAWRESHRDICSQAFVEAHTTERQLQYIRDSIQGGKQFYLLTDQKPCAVVSVCRHVIADLYVHPDLQGMGYGSKLLQFAMSQCKGTLTLWVLNVNQRARRLYQYLGFTESGIAKKLSDHLSEIEMKYEGGH